VGRATRFGTKFEGPSEKNGAKARSAPRFAYGGLDRVIHERARLSVLTSLITNPAALAFGELKQLCGLTDGNLSRHLQVLEESKLVSISKGLRKNRQKTLCRITALGRKRYIEYLTVLEQVIVDADRAVKAGSLARGGQNPANAPRWKISIGSRLKTRRRAPRFSFP
jgi:DNA-binding MarR family transcriptional regulator